MVEKADRKDVDKKHNIMGKGGVLEQLVNSTDSKTPISPDDACIQLINS
jgi:hypothetical protein